MRALLIGNSFYRPGGPWGSLSGCARDAGRVEDFLRHRLDVPADRIRKLTASIPRDGGTEPPEPPEDRPTYENMICELLRLAREAERGEQVLIYFTGHGGRIPTCIPEVKRLVPFDEVLLPWNAAVPSARCLRDVELGVILRELVESRGALVTLVLDCCHAGATTRLAEIPREIGVRGSSVVDERPWPAESLVGPRPSLEATWKSLDTGPRRDVRLVSGWQPNPRGYVLLAACRAGELAFEFPFEGREKRGVFTRAFLEALRHLAPGQSYRRLHDRIVAEVHSRFEQQNPVLEGDENREVFGDKHVHEPPAVNVLRVERGGKRLLLETGRSQGIERRARFIIQDLGEAPLALAQITAAGSTESWSRVVESYRRDSLEPGFRAVPEAPHFGRSVRLPQTSSDQGRRTLDAVAQSLARGDGKGFVRIARKNEGADFLVSINSRDCCEIQDPAGAPLPHLPPLSAAASGAAQRLVDLLIHLAKFRNVQRLVNHDWRSPLRTALVVEMGYPPTDWREGQPAVLTKATPVRRVRCRNWVFVRLVNTSKQDLSVGVLDLQPDWGISLVLPQGGDSVMLGRGEEQVLPLRVDLPSGLREGTDLLKIMAVTGRVDFRWLKLPSLEPPSPFRRPVMRGVTRGAPRQPSDELEVLFAALTADSAPKRGPRQPTRYPGREWTVAHLEIEVVR